MIGIADLRSLGGRELARVSSLLLQAVIAIVATEALAAPLQPEMLEVRHPYGFADRAKGVEIFVADPIPVLELDPQFEGRCGRAQKRLFVDTEQIVEGACRGNGGFPNADRSDFIGFDQGD